MTLQQLPKGLHCIETSESDRLCLYVRRYVGRPDRRMTVTPIKCHRICRQSHGDVFPSIQKSQPASLRSNVWFAEEWESVLHSGAWFSSRGRGRLKQFWVDIKAILTSDGSLICERMSLITGEPRRDCLGRRLPIQGAQRQRDYKVHQMALQRRALTMTSVLILRVRPAMCNHGFMTRYTSRRS